MCVCLCVSEYVCVCVCGMHHTIVCTIQEGLYILNYKNRSQYVGCPLWRSEEMKQIIHENSFIIHKVYVSTCVCVCVCVCVWYVCVGVCVVHVYA